MAQNPRPKREPLAPGRPPHTEVRFADLFDGAPAEEMAGECTPPMDVLEVSDGIEILMDLPGVTASDLRLIVVENAVIVAGRKLPAACAHREAAFHLAERSFGRFVRAFRIPGAVDAGRASAILTGGELRIRLPRLAERRGQHIPITLEQA